MKSVCMCMCMWMGLGVGLAGCVVVNDQHGTLPNTTRAASPAPNAPAAPLIRGAVSGQRQLLISFYANAPDCTTLGYPTLKVAKAPAHGQVSIEQGTAIAGFGIDDLRSPCNGRTVPATVIYYTSETGFVGDDSVAFDRIGVAGVYAYHEYVIKVR